MKCENCNSEKASEQYSGMQYCKPCAAKVNEKVNDLAHIFDVIRDEKRSGSFKPERFGGCISNCESIGHDKCHCRGR